jgi:GxxExxY protein
VKSAVNSPTLTGVDLKGLLPRISRITRMEQKSACHPPDQRIMIVLMLHEDTTKDIIGAAMAVLNAFKPGLDEKLYENALVIELLLRGHTVEQQRDYPVHYRGQFIGKLVPDLIVDGKVITDSKVVTAFNETHVAQMLGYLNITGLQVALLLNFKESKLEWKRVVNEHKGKTGDAADQI